VFFPSQGKIWSSLYRKENLQQLNEKSHEIMQEKLFNVSQRMTFQRGILGNASGRWIQIVEWLIFWYILRCNDQEVGILAGPDNTSPHTHTTLRAKSNLFSSVKQNKEHVGVVRLYLWWWKISNAYWNWKLDWYVRWN